MVDTGTDKNDKSDNNDKTRDVWRDGSFLVV